MAIHENKKDVKRAVEAAKLVIDGREPIRDMPAILVTLEHLTSLVLLACMGSSHRAAIHMLNEGLVPGIESRIAQHAANGGNL